ncbi:MAG: magnesium transporter MgtE [Selenomonadaceae bacterium]|nr:magnesium transporter MgtE [Selenomonadaceae bacterium]
MAGKKGGFIGKIVKFLLFIFMLLILAVGGFAAGVYFQLIDSEQTQQVNEVLKLWKLPVVGEFFEKPEGYVEEEEEVIVEQEDKSKIETVNLQGNNLSAKAEIKSEKKKSKDVKVSQKDIEKQMQEREAAEKKRVSKLARIYGNMKAEEAAEALGYVEADTAVLIMQKMDEDAAGKILAKMDPTLAAQITQMLYEGTQQRVGSSPYDRQTNENVVNPEEEQ